MYLFWVEYDALFLFVFFLHPASAYFAHMDFFLSIVYYSFIKYIGYLFSR